MRLWGMVVIEVTMNACKKLVNEGRMYIEWNAFKVKEYENVLRCYGCFGYGLMHRDCKVGKVCRKCGKGRRNVERMNVVASRRDLQITLYCRIYAQNI